ncbi:MAG: glutaryl-7-ACA acylase, partial [Pyrinomonadaceae bacterium]|nr:glutaryl-7-ACA acylase [Pyrinomonadaceae bacterium]
MSTKILRTLALLAALPCAVLFIETGAAQTPRQAPTTLTSETPARIEPTNDGFDYIRRSVMIPMRDGVKLHTVILVPKNAVKVAGRAGDAPILLTRTPYNANGLTSHSQSSHLGSILSGYDNATDVIVEGGY